MYAIFTYTNKRAMNCASSILATCTGFEFVMGTAGKIKLGNGKRRDMTAHLWVWPASVSVRGLIPIETMAVFNGDRCVGYEWGMCLEIGARHKLSGRSCRAWFFCEVLRQSRGSCMKLPPAARRTTG